MVTAWILRLLGLAAMFAIVAVFMPMPWMAAVHKYLGLGEMPEGPIVEYMARSLSAAYVALGFILWHVSFRVAENLRLVRLLGVAFTLLGAVLWWIDGKAGMPMAWILQEGPPAILAGLGSIYSCREGASDGPSAGQ